MNAYEVRIETDEYGHIVVPLCEDCLPDNPDIHGHISDCRHYEEEGVEQPTCYDCNRKV